MALLYAFRDEAGIWHGEPDLSIDWSTPNEAPLTIVDPRSPYHRQVVLARLAATEGSRRGGIGAYVVLDNGYKLCATEYVERLLFPWTETARFHGTHPSAAEPQPPATVSWDRELSPFKSSQPSVEAE